MKHDELAHMLAERLEENGRIVLEKVNLGGVWSRMGSNTRGIVDVIAFAPHFNNPDITVYEIKVGRADFRSDIITDKWKKYQKFCNRVVFAFPYGLIEKEEIPEDAGMVTWNQDKKTWHFAKRGNTNPKPEFDFEMLMALLLSWDKKMKRKEARIHIMKYFVNGEKRGFRELKAHFGETVSYALRKQDDTERALREAREFRKRLEERFKEETGKNWWEQ